MVSTPLFSVHVTFSPQLPLFAALRLQRDSSHLQITEIHTAISIQSVVN
jgi:hypothetical protein